MVRDRGRDWPNLLKMLQVYLVREGTGNKNILDQTKWENVLDFTTASLVSMASIYDIFQ
ncbi:MAG TPA: hypothetical protein VNI77_10990 [Nitrososphaera sp.]|nr:hypothetical protein [Nitrososphaera sp.]